MSGAPAQLAEVTRTKPCPPRPNPDLRQSITGYIIPVARVCSLPIGDVQGYLCDR
jgi:hypothetical protein